MLICTWAPLRLEAHLALGVNLQHLGDAVVARTHVEQALVLFDPKQHRVHAVLYGHDPQVACLADLACILWVLGYPDQARQRSHEALTMAQTVDHVYSRALVHFFAAWSAQLRRHPQDTLAQAAAVLTLAQEHAFSYLEAMGRVFQGWAVAMQGQVAEGMAQMHQGLAAYQAIVGGVALPHFLGMLAEMCGQAGQTAEGLACLPEALAIVHRTGDCWWEAELYRLKGELLLSRSAGDYAEADTCLRCALDISMAGSPRALIPPTSRMPKPCWKSSREAQRRGSDWTIVWPRSGVETTCRLPADSFDHFGVIKYRLWGALEDNLAAINSIQSVGDFRGVDQIRLGDQHRYAHRLDLLDHLGKALHDDGRQPLKRLVQE